MTREQLFGYACASLDGLGFEYRRNGELITFTASLSGMRWRVVIKAASEKRLACFAVYPWTVFEDRRRQMLELLCELNAHSNFGSYFLMTASDGRLLTACRADAHIVDEFNVLECVEAAVADMAALVCSRWERIFFECSPNGGR